LEEKKSSILGTKVKKETQNTFMPEHTKTTTKIGGSAVREGGDGLSRGKGVQKSCRKSTTTKKPTVAEPLPRGNYKGDAGSPTGVIEERKVETMHYKATENILKKKN